MKHAFDITEPKVVFASKSVLDAVINAEYNLRRKNIIVFGEDCDGTTNFTKFLETGDANIEKLTKITFDPIEHTALILLSSGTTGLPKCVMLTHENLRTEFVALT